MAVTEPDPKDRPTIQACDITHYKKGQAYDAGVGATSGRLPLRSMWSPRRLKAKLDKMYPGWRDLQIYVEGHDLASTKKAMHELGIPEAKRMSRGGWTKGATYETRF